MNYSNNKLRGRIIEYYGKQGNFANELGITESCLSGKLRGRKIFNYHEIKLMCKLLEIKDDEIGLYFFTEAVDDKTTSITKGA